MNSNIEYYNCSDLIDFNFYLSDKAGYVTGTPAVNQWTFDTNLKSIWVNVDNTKAGYIRFPKGSRAMGIKASTGDFMELSADVLNESGEKVKLIVEYSATEDFSNPVTVEYYATTSSDTFEQTTLKYYATADGYYRFVFGLLTAEAGSFYLRNAIVSITKIVNNNPIRRIALEKVSGVFNQRTDFAYDPCIVEHDADGYTLNVTFNRPLVGLRPIAFVNQEYYTITNKYIARLSYASLTGFKIRFYPITTTPSNNAILLADLPDAYNVSILVVGEWG